MFCFSGHKQYKDQPIAEALNGGINALERMLRISFPAFSCQDFGCVCFCRHASALKKIYPARRITCRRNKHKDMLRDASVLSHLIKVGEAGNSWGSRGLDEAVSSPVAEVLGGGKRWHASSAQLSGVSGSLGCCIVATELVYRALNFLRRTCRRKEDSILRIALLHLFVK